MSDEYSALIGELLRQKQQQAPVWYQLRAVGLALAKAAESMGGAAARDLGTGPVSVDVPCPKCGARLLIQRTASDFGPIEQMCKCGYRLYIK